MRLFGLAIVGVLLAYPVAAAAQAVKREDLIGTWVAPKGTPCYGERNGGGGDEYSIVLDADSLYSDHCKQQRSGKEQLSTGTVTLWHMAGDTLWLGWASGRDSAWAVYTVAVKGNQLTLVDLNSDAKKRKPPATFDLADRTTHKP